MKIKHVYIGLYHYIERYGSVCSSDVRGTLKPQDGIAGGYGGAHELVERFKEGIRLDFVDVKEHFVIKWP